MKKENEKAHLSKNTIYKTKKEIKIQWTYIAIFKKQSIKMAKTHNEINMKKRSFKIGIKVQ